MDQIEKRALASLKDAAQNSRKHSAGQIDQIAASIQKFGWTIPVLIDESGVIIAGHARVRAAKQLGMEEAPCIVAAGWTADQKEAYQIADNRLGELSEWDSAILTDQIKRLNAADFDMGFLDMSAFKLDMETFAPSLVPTTNTTAVTPQAVANEKEKLANQFQAKDPGAPGAAKGLASSYTVICPHCGEEFDVSI